MIIKYAIVSIDAPSRSAVVSYYSDIVPAPGIRLNITFYNDPIPSGQALDDYILARAPADWFAMQALPRDLSALGGLIGQERSGDPAAAKARLAQTLTVKVA